MGLAGETEILVEMASHGDGSGACRPPALVANEDRRLIVIANDQEGLLESRVEPGQVGEIGAVLAVGVHHDSVQASICCTLAETLHSIVVDEVGDERHRRRQTEIGQLHLC